MSIPLKFSILPQALTYSYKLSILPPPHKGWRPEGGNILSWDSLTTDHITVSKIAYLAPNPFEPNFTLKTNKQTLSSAAAHHSVDCWFYYYWFVCFHWFIIWRPTSTQVATHLESIHESHIPELRHWRWDCLRRHALRSQQCHYRCLCSLGQRQPHLGY